MKNSSERKRYKTNPNFDAYLLYSYIQMKRNASDKISRDKADKLIYEYLNNYIMYELYYSYRSTLEKCEFQELYQSLWVEVLADLPRFNPDLGRATTFFRYSIKHAVCIFVSFKKYNTTPYDKLKLDLMYIQNYSWLMDMEIIFLTVKILFMKDSTEGFTEEQCATLDIEEAKNGTKK